MSSEKSRQFVEYAIANINGENKRFRAKLSRADNPATEYQCWEILARWVDLENLNTRRAYALVGAGLARARPKDNGNIGVGSALHRVISEKPDRAADKAADSTRLRRLLACHDQNELVSVLRSTLRLIESKALVLDFARLLDEILWFNSEKSRERTLSRWAQEFYGRKEQEE